MKKYASFDAYFADQSASNQAIIRALRALVKKTVPHLEESVKWGNGVWLAGTHVRVGRPPDGRYPRGEYRVQRWTHLTPPGGMNNGAGIRRANRRRLQPVAFVYSRPGYVEFGFFAATSLDDPDGLLEGKGEHVRHVKMRKPADVKRPGVVKLLRAAAR